MLKWKQLENWDEDDTQAFFDLISEKAPEIFSPAQFNRKQISKERLFWFSFLTGKKIIQIINRQKGLIEWLERSEFEGRISCQEADIEEELEKYTTKLNIQIIPQWLFQEN